MRFPCYFFTEKQNDRMEPRKEESMAETKAKKGKISPDEILVKLCEEILYDKKGENILRLDLREYSALCDYFLLCTATSSPHVGALAERVRREVLEQLKLKPLHMDGTAESGWMIVDYGNVMVHIMTEEKRQEYQLETLWNDVPAVDAVKRIEAQLRKKTQARKKKAEEGVFPAEKPAAKKAPAKKAAAKKPAAKKAPAKKTAAKKTAVKKPAAKKSAK